MGFDSLSASAASHSSWARTRDRAARTAAARAAQQAALEAGVDPDGVMSPADRAKAIKNAQAARMLAMSAKAKAKRQAQKAKTNGAPPRPATTATAVAAQAALDQQAASIRDEGIRQTELEAELK